MHVELLPIVAQYHQWSVTTGVDAAAGVELTCVTGYIGTGSRLHPTIIRATAIRFTHRT